MHWLELPLPASTQAPAFQDIDGAREWLKTQPEAEAMQMQRSLLTQIEAIDVSAKPPAVRLGLLDALRPSVTVVQAANESRFLRKPLPMAPDDEAVFALAQGLWAALAVANLRIARELPDAERTVPLHRASIAVRMAVYCHFQSARDIPDFLRHLVFAVLGEAASAEALNTPLRDPVFPVFGESPLSGQLAWTCLLLLIDPYHLSVAQLTVANRALSRWRDLGGFLNAPDPDPRARAVPLERLFGGPLPAGVPGWLDVRPVTRKIRQRVEALRQGETPEGLKLGRELSGEACIRLLHDLDNHLRLKLGTGSTEVGEIDLVFGAADAYALFADEYLNPRPRDPKRDAIAHQRMEIFGFDRLSQLSNAVKRIQVDVAFESWLLVDGQAVRAATAGARRVAPCLVGAMFRDGPRLGVLAGLRTGSDGQLQARLLWYLKSVEAATLFLPPPPMGKQAPPRQAAFLLTEPSGLSLIVTPTAGVRLNAEVKLKGAPFDAVLPFEVLERGVDFVRYACAPV